MERERRGDRKKDRTREQKGKIHQKNGLMR